MKANIDRHNGREMLLLSDCWNVDIVSFPPLLIFFGIKKGMNERRSTVKDQILQNLTYGNMKKNSMQVKICLLVAMVMAVILAFKSIFQKPKALRFLVKMTSNCT